MATEGGEVPDFAVSTESGDDGQVVAAVRGELDMLTAPVLDAELEAATGRQPATLVVDMSGVTFLDSSGCHTLVRARQRADGANITLELVGLNGSCKRVLEIAGLTELFNLSPVRRDGDS
jgi:anti-sigma B factor antagonist